MNTRSTTNWIGLWTLIRRESQRFLRVPIQTLVTPWITAGLYIFIFGTVVGSRIDEIGGFSYLEFVLPGVLMMNLLMAAFQQTSSSLYFQRFARHIEEMLVAPLSHVEMVIGYIVGGIIRGIVVGGGIFIIAVFVGAAEFAHVPLFLFYVLVVSVVFGLLGLIVGLWAEQFEHLTILGTFVLLPLSFLGGVFNTVDMLPESLQPLLFFNPIFYFVDGIRFSMIGFSEAPIWIGAIVLLGFGAILSMVVWYLFKIGWRLRE